MQQLTLFSQSGSVGPGPAALSLVTADEEARLAASLPTQVQAQFDLAGDLPLVAVDAEPLRQLLGHLLDNARESVGTPGTIRVTGRVVEISADDSAAWVGEPAPGRYVELAVADSGAGLPPEAKQRLFAEPFFTSKPRHRGLGLAIVCRILYARGGGLRLEPGAGGGTVARVLLPAD
jgi:signal transduction histidine kinase